ncbi:MAG: transglutaminase-like domain-containing protein [Nitrosopumilaceae archaeon]|nr:transglutaminase-like domain-containing protein [Nitrosopumilaceae archaeon]
MSLESNPIIKDWISLVNDSDIPLAEKSLKMAQLLEYSDLDINKYIQKISELGNAIKSVIPQNDNPKYQLSLLNEEFFHTHKFFGDQEDYYNPQNNFLNAVIDKKSGLPITLSILYVEVAKHLGLDLKIVGFPSHIVVKYDEEIILDPFNEGKLLDIDDLQAILDRNFGGQIDFAPEFLDEITSKMILTRMARNLKNSYAQSYDYKKSKQCVDMVLAVEPDSPEEIRDKGIIEERLGNYEIATKYLNQYLEINPNGEDIDFILELIKSIRTKTSQ